MPICQPWSSPEAVLPVASCRVIAFSTVEACRHSGAHKPRSKNALWTAGFAPAIQSEQPCLRAFWARSVIMLLPVASRLRNHSHHGPIATPAFNKGSSGRSTGIISKCPAGVKTRGLLLSTPMTVNLLAFIRESGQMQSPHFTTAASISLRDAYPTASESTTTLHPSRTSGRNGPP